MLKAILIDDDESNLSSLSEKLAKTLPTNAVIVANAIMREDGIKTIEGLQPDVVFLGY